MNIYVSGKGPASPKIAFVGEAPSYDEEKSLTPFTGPAGNVFTNLCNSVGINRNNCWITNVSKFRIPANPKFGRKIPFIQRAQSVGIDVNEQINNLRNELKEVAPNVICCLGGTALWAVTGKNPIASWRGSIIVGMNGIKTIGTYHPAHILHNEGEVKGYWNKTVMAFDLKRVKKQSEFKDFRLPRRTLHVAKSSHQVYDFFQRYRDYDFPAVDIEAHKCIPSCIGFSFARHEGITIPLWNNEGLSDIPDNDIVNCWRIVAEMLWKYRIVGQNFGYDRDKLRRLGFIIKGLKSDVMLKSFAIQPELPKNLAFNTSIYTEEPYYKDEGMYEGSINDLLIGCARDACVTKEIDEEMDKEIDELGTRKYYENFLLPLHDLYLEIENNGLRTDEQIRISLLQKYIEWDERIRYELFQIARAYINCSSPKQIASLLYGTWKIPERKGTGEEVLTQLLNGNAVKREEHKRGIELILEDRRVKKTINSYLYSPTDYDGRMRTSYFLCLETGRSSTNQQEPPIRPSIEYRDREEGKNVKKKQSRGMAFQTITKHGDIGADIRTMFIPDEGEIFLQADSSQAEARVIFILADDYQALEDIDKHDYHALTASWFFGGTESDYSKKVLGYESPIRFAGKTLRHAGHLGAGKRRAATELNTQARKYKIDFRISEAKAGQALEIFHSKQPKIKQVFHAEVIRCLEKNRRLSAPVPYGIDANMGGTRTFFERWNDELFRQAFSYLPQRTVSENTKGAALRVRARSSWIKILVEAHDALLTSVPIERAQEAALILKEEFERPIDFSTCSLKRGKLVIPCDVESGYNYKDLSKFKWIVPEVV